MNGKQFRASLNFLGCLQSQWAVKMLSITIEGSKILTHYWMSCLNNSMRLGSRPPLYKVLDPRSSILTQALQYYASLLFNVCGGGRLLFLWTGSGYTSYADFCACQPDRVPDIRRTFMLCAAWIYRRHFAYLHRDMFSITLVGDPDAYPGMCDEVLQAWDRKHICCVPSGFARDLKKDGITSKELMSTGWRETMFWTASTIQLSCADIEALHSQNRALAGSAFHSISSCYINSESNRFAKEAFDIQSASHKKTISKDDALLNGGAKHECIGSIMVKDCTGKKATPKGMSPLELFRKHYIKTYSSAGTLNPCSKECWADVKQRWAELSKEEQDLYRALSEQSAVDALAMRARRDQAKGSTDNKSASGSDLPVVANMDFPAIHAQALPLSQVCELVSSPDALQKALRDELETSSAIPKSRFPLGEEALERAWQSQKSKGISGKESIKAFRVESERIARPSDDDTFPSKVTHESCCGEQCRHFADRRRVALHSQLLRQFGEIVSHKGGVKHVVLADVLCDLDLADRPFISVFQFLSHIGKTCFNFG